MTLTVQINLKTKRLIHRLARKRGWSKSDVIRDAIDVLAKREQEQEKTERSYDSVRDLIGSVRGGQSDLSERTGDRLRRMLQDRNRRS